MTSKNEAAEKARKGVFAVLAQAGIISRDDRLELAADILDMKVDSFSDLSDNDLIDLHFGLQSWRRVQNVRSANGALLREAEDVVSDIHDIDLSEWAEEKAMSLPEQNNFADGYGDENQY